MNISDVAGVALAVGGACFFSWRWTADYYKNRTPKGNPQREVIYDLAYDLYRDAMDRPIPPEPTRAAEGAIDQAQTLIDVFNRRIP